ncbi:MAG: hypothetical protein Tsb0020_25860 [Haliangiales bacterium]
MSRSHRAALVAIGVLLAAPAAADPIPVDITSTTTAGWRTRDANFDDASYGELFEKLNLASTLGRWRLSLRLDTATFLSNPAADVVGRYTPEKLSVSYQARALSVTAGDAYVSFGRGLSLSLRKVDELGLDTTLRGAKLLLHMGDLDATVVAGYANINNVDEATGRSVDDPYDLIAGAQAQLRVADRVTVGAHVSGVLFRDALGFALSDDYTDRVLQVGATADAPRLLEDLGLYVEGMVQSVSTEPAAEHELAYALYATATAYLGSSASLLFEGKLYGPLTPLNPNLDSPFDGVVYSSPPTVERVLQPLENPQRDIAGGRARFDWRHSPALLTYVNYGLFRDWLGYADPAMVGQIRDGTIHDAYAGAELRWNDSRSWAIGAGGYRAVYLDGPTGLVRGDGHFEVDIAQALTSSWSLTLHAIHLERTKRSSAILDERFREGTIDAGFRLRPWIAVSVGYDYTTEPTQPERDYLHGNLAWDITPSSNLRLFVGSARGGLKCVSGVCRVFPPFEGAKATLTLRY